MVPGDVPDAMQFSHVDAAQIGRGKKLRPTEEIENRRKSVICRFGLVTSARIGDRDTSNNSPSPFVDDETSVSRRTSPARYNNKNIANVVDETGTETTGNDRRKKLTEENKTESTNDPERSIITCVFCTTFEYLIFKNMSENGTRI